MASPSAHPFLDRKSAAQSFVLLDVLQANAS